ncbi:YecA family protein [Veronia nyctiphanis]|uniref:UPF0149 protein CS022_16640 n=1 Tax=Veronia nyctiphanis TaxID=1278244 RepID=A0A4Q0YNB5_9GAMM|nr:YecA family protein [Veronia nyctiphanis]RXJ72316.1 YecA family protein [Veronia nyctiphanis]
MTDTTLPQYEAIKTTLSTSSLAVTPAEMHGLLAGMMCGGLDSEQGTWVPMLYDFTNDGMAWPTNAMLIATNSMSIIKGELLSDELSFSLLLPDEDGDLIDRADALSEWVSSFMAGIGLMNIKQADLDSDIKEALGDLTEIAQLGVDEDDDMEEQSILFEQVIEHVRVCAMTIHAVLGKRQPPEQNKTLH